MTHATSHISSSSGRQNPYIHSLSGLIVSPRSAIESKDGRSRRCPDLVMCSKSATQQCAQCRSQIYCGKQCQKSDWRVHKLLCSSYQQFQTPPHENARRAIVFEQNEPVVKFKWVSIEIRDAGEPGEPELYESPILEEYFGPGERGHSQLYNNNVMRGRRLRDYIDLRFRDSFLVDGSTPNRAVAAVAPSAGGNVWCGPLIALKWEGPAQLPNDPPYTHIEMGDLREVVDYLTTYARLRT